MKIARKPLTNTLTVAQVLARLRHDSRLPAWRRKDLRKSVSALVRHSGLDPHQTEARFGAFRDAVRTIEPAGLGVSQQWWRRLRSDAAMAFARYSAPTDFLAHGPVTSEWRPLLRASAHIHHVRYVTRFMRYCSRRGIRPIEVTDQVSEAFRGYLFDHTAVNDPRATHAAMCRSWNRAVFDVTGWPRIRLAVPTVQRPFSLPLSSFPATFAADIRAWINQVSGTDLLQGPSRPLRPATIKHRRWQFIYLASAIVRSGQTPDRITSIAALFEPDNFTRGIRYLWERAGRTPTPSLLSLVRNLRLAGKHSALLTPSQLGKMDDLVRKFQYDGRRLTERNRTVLRQFDNPENVRRFTALPETLVRASRRAASRRRTALLVQTALAIDILLVAPIRLSTLRRLRLSNFRRAGRGDKRTVHLVVQSREIKTGMPLQFELPRETIALLDIYLRDHRPVMTSKGTDALFPGSLGGPKGETTFIVQIKLGIRRYAGLDVNIHAFRHIAAKLLLQKHPQQYQLVALLLGHRNVQTAMDYYCELDVPAVARSYGREVLGRTFSGP